MSKKKKLIIAGIVAGVIIVIAAVVGIILAVTKKENGSSKDRVYVESVASVCGMSTVGVNSSYAGKVETQDTLDVKVDPERKVLECLVSVGDEVEVGTELFKYDTSDLESQVNTAKLELESFDNEIADYNNQIASLTAEKKNAPTDQQLEYTMQIQSIQLSIQQTNLEKNMKNAEITKLNTNIANSTVKSTMAGVIKAINESGGTNSEGVELPYMTILATGEYRVKGSIDEQSLYGGFVVEGASVIVRSRVDESQTWKGTISKVDTENNETNQNNGYMMEGGGESATRYPFYVELESSEGLMLGQHVFIEPDYGQSDVEVKEGIWLDEYYIDQTGDEPFVWVADKKMKLEKRVVELGEYDADMMRYEIKSGLDEEDYICWPMDNLYEGIKCVTNYEEVDYEAPLYQTDGMDDLSDEDMLREYVEEETE